MSDKKKEGFTFVTNKMCPYAQKAWIALEYQDVSYDMKEISLYGPNGKPDWFWKLNSKGTVPVLVVEDQSVVITESDEIVEYLFDSSKKKEESYWKALLRQRLAPIGKSAVLSGRYTAELKQVLKEMNQHISSNYLCGDQLLSVDCQLFPFVWRLHQEYEAQLKADAPRVIQWMNYCLESQPCFGKTVQSAWWWWW